MATNLQLDDKLIAKAVKLGGHQTKKAAVMRALSDYVHHLEQEHIIGLFGVMEYDSKYDYKKQRTKV